MRKVLNLFKALFTGFLILLFMLLVGYGFIMLLLSIGGILLVPVFALVMGLGLF